MMSAAEAFGAAKRYRIDKAVAEERLQERLAAEVYSVVAMRIENLITTAVSIGTYRIILDPGNLADGTYKATQQCMQKLIGLGYYVDSAPNQYAVSWFDPSAGPLHEPSK